MSIYTNALSILLKRYLEISQEVMTEHKNEDL